MKSQEVNLQNHRNCSPLGLGVRSRQKPVRRLRNPPLKLNNVLNRLPPWSSLRACSVGSFCNFQKITFWDFTAFFSFLTRENLVFFRYSYEEVLKLICVQISLNLTAWILVSVALKK